MENINLGKYGVMKALSVAGSIGSLVGGVVVGKKVYDVVDESTGNSKLALGVGVTSGVGTAHICNTVVQIPIAGTAALCGASDISRFVKTAMNEMNEVNNMQSDDII